MSRALVTAGNLVSGVPGGGTLLTTVVSTGDAYVYADVDETTSLTFEKLKRAESLTIPAWFDYRSVSGLSREMQETLDRVRPSTLGQASRIAGVTPAAVTLVNIYIEIQGRGRQQLQQQPA